MADTGPGNDTRESSSSVVAAVTGGAQRPMLFWLGGLLVLVAILWLLKGILLPFVAGMAVAYFLDPVADRLEKWGCSRILATTIITILFVIISFGLVIGILPMLYNQVVALVQNLPQLANELRAFLVDISDGRLAQFVGERAEQIEQAMSGATGKAVNWALEVLGSIWSQSLAFFSLLSLVFVTPVVAFYLLNDWDRMMGRIDDLLPRGQADTIRKLAGEVDDVLAGFVRGQGTVCIVLGVFYATALTLAGLKYGLVVGLIAGFISFIPYLGSLTGFVLSTILAFMQFWPDYLHIGVVIGIFLVGQAIEGNFLSPKLVGDRVRLHPVWVMFALFAFGYLFGFVGMLLAVPIAAAIGVLVRFAVERYLQSPLYLSADRNEGQGGSDP